MEQQKVFPTACFGFDKKVVLDYIYEQDTAAKARQAELEKRANQLEEQVTELQSSVEELSAQCELAKGQLYSEKETAAALRSSYEKLKADTDQLVQVARNKDKELQIQLELNRQLQLRNGELENRMTDMSREMAESRSEADELMEEAREQAALLLERARREAKAIREAAKEAVAREAAAKEDNSAEAARLREELGHLRETVGKTLSRFEGAISRLGSDKEEQAAPPAASSPAPEKEEPETRFFTNDPGQREAGRVKIKIRR